MTELDSLLQDFVAAQQKRGEAAATRELISRLGARSMDIDAWRSMAESMLRAGLAGPAAALLDHALLRIPDAGDLRYLRGNALRIGGNREAAEQDFIEALRHDPMHRDAAFSLAFMRREDGRILAATEVLVALCKQRSGDLSLTLDVLDFLRECAAYREALPLAREARRRWPDDARIAARAGESALALGAFEEAAEDLRAALDRDPRQSESWLRLAYCRRYSDRDDADLRRFQNGWAGSDLDPAARICAGFALGKAFDDLGDWARAADVLRSANALACAASGWRVEAWRQLVEQRLRAPPLPVLRADPDFVPVFIVGLPRTGTTLVASALGSDPLVRDRGELNWIPAMHAHLHRRGQLNDAGMLASVARLIRAQMRCDDAPARFFIDKNPLNFRYLDFIAALFPNARIIHCRRRPRDTALSLWMQHFAHQDLGFTYSWSGIADVWKGYEALMARWHSTPGIHWLDLDYEAFVAEPEDQERRLTEFLGIAAPAEAPSNPSSPRTGAVPSIVTTASVWQVRQPVYTRSVGRWRHYAPYLPELLAQFPE